MLFALFAVLIVLAIQLSMVEDLAQATKKAVTEVEDECSMAPSSSSCRCDSSLDGGALTQDGSDAKQQQRR